MDAAAALSIRRGALVPTAEDYLAFARLLLNKGMHEGRRLVSVTSVELMTTNHLRPEQIAAAGRGLGGRGWGFSDPSRSLVAMAMTQVSDILFNGTTTEFARLAARSVPNAT